MAYQVHDSIRLETNTDGCPKTSRIEYLQRILTWQRSQVVSIVAKKAAPLDRKQIAYTVVG